MGLFSDINKVQLLGNLTKKPELKSTSNGYSVMVLDIATNRNYKKGDEWVKDVEYHSVVVWGNKAEQLKERVAIGTRVLIEGRLTTRSYEDKNGVKKYKTEVVASDVILLSNFIKKDNNYVDQNTANITHVVDPNDLPF